MDTQSEKSSHVELKHSSLGKTKMTSVNKREDMHKTDNSFTHSGSSSFRRTGFLLNKVGASSAKVGLFPTG